MRGFAAVFRREIAERRLLFWTGLLGFFPFLLPFAPLGTGELRSEAAFGLGIVASAVLALGLGTSIVARDLAERRLGFYFSRPLSGWAIWAGKLGAGLALSLGAGALVLVPALLLDPGTVRFDLLVAGGGGAVLAGLLAGVAVLLALLLLAHAASIMVRSHSPWLVLDLAGLVTLTLLLWAAGRRLLLAGAPMLLPRIGGDWSASPVNRLGAPFVLLAFAAASAVQVFYGRTDPRRAHRCLSAVLWSLLLALGFGFEAYSRWAVAVTPADLLRIEGAIPAPAGSWVLVQGPAAHRGGFRPVFLLDALSGRSVRLRLLSYPLWRSPVHFSADGRRAAWLERSGTALDSPQDLVLLDLARPGAEPVRTALSFARDPAALALSPDGRRLAALDGTGRLTVDDLGDLAGRGARGQGRLLAAVALPAPGSEANLLRFLDASHLRYVHGIRTRDLERARTGGPAETREIVEIIDLDIGGIGGGDRPVVGRTAPLAGPVWWELSPDGSRLLVQHPQGEAELYAARGGARLASLPPDLRTGGFLADSRMVAIGAGWRDLVLLSPAGAELRRFHFPGARALRLGGQPLPDHLAVEVLRESRDRASRGSLFDLDLSTGSTRPLGRPGLRPLAWPEAAPGNAVSRLFLDGAGRLVLLDPATGGERRVAPAASAASAAGGAR
ncbi:MAG TPA: hypothetical protein VGR07_17405 [Thermoanaerobaculia bacterium]|nr:hypothetical protein [Thermoanaerobaculia bacterium]